MPAFFCVTIATFETVLLAPAGAVKAKHVAEFCVVDARDAERRGLRRRAKEEFGEGRGFGRAVLVRGRGGGWEGRETITKWCRAGPSVITKIKLFN